MALDAAAQRAAAEAAAARRRIEAAAREAARRAEQAREEAKQHAKPAPIRAPALNHRSGFELTQKPKVDLKPPATAQLSAEETQAYVTAAKAITRKDPTADPHQII